MSLIYESCLLSMSHVLYSSLRRTAQRESLCSPDAGLCFVTCTETHCIYCFFKRDLYGAKETYPRHVFQGGLCFVKETYCSYFSFKRDFSLSKETYSFSKETYSRLMFARCGGDSYKRVPTTLLVPTATLLPYYYLTTPYSLLYFLITTLLLPTPITLPYYYLTTALLLPTPILLPYCYLTTTKVWMGLLKA